MDELATLDSGLDQPIEMWAEIGEDIDNIALESAQTKDFEVMMRGILRYKVLLQSSGMALAKILYRAKQVWDMMDIEGDLYEILSERAGITETTVKRYISVWQMHEEKMIPAEVSEKLMKRGIHYQVNIANMVHQGYQPSEAQWDRLAESPDTHTISSVIREIKQVPPRKGVVTLTMNRKGEIYVNTTNNRYLIGRLFLEKITPGEMDAIYLGIRRVISSAHFIETT